MKKRLIYDYLYIAYHVAPILTNGKTNIRKTLYFYSIIISFTTAIKRVVVIYSLVGSVNHRSEDGLSNESETGWPKTEDIMDVRLKIF